VRCGVDRDFHTLGRCADEGGPPQKESLGVNRASRVNRKPRTSKSNAIAKPSAAYSKEVISSGLTCHDRHGVRGVRRSRQGKVSGIHGDPISAKLDYMGASRSVISDHQLSRSESWCHRGERYPKRGCSPSRRQNAQEAAKHFAREIARKRITKVEKSGADV